MRVCGFLLLLFLHATAVDDQDYFPLLYCTNPHAEAGACPVESKVALQALFPWFARFLPQRGGGDQRRRWGEVLDCSRFCDDNIPYYTLQAPCDCSYLYRRRHMPQLSAADEPSSNSNHHYGKRTSRHGNLRHGSNNNKNSQGQLQLSPIQLLEQFVEAMHPGKCRDIIAASHCFVTLESGGYGATDDNNDAALNKKNVIDASSHGGFFDAVP